MITIQLKFAGQILADRYFLAGQIFRSWDTSVPGPEYLSGNKISVRQLYICPPISVRPLAEYLPGDLLEKKAKVSRQPGVRVVHAL